MDQPLNPTTNESVPATSDPSAMPGGPSVPTPVASYIHTFIVIVIMVCVSLMSAKTMDARRNIPNPPSPAAQYLTTLAWLWLLSALCYIGMRARKIRLIEVIGGRWKSFDDFLIDIAIAAGFWLTSALCLAGVKFALNHGKATTLNDLPEAAKSIAALIPHTPREIALWIALSITAGLCEEFVFRGYLQRQFTALTRNAAAGIALSAMVFGVGHLYQGAQQVFIIALYGAMFGTLAYFRKSVRPGMMAHAWQDTLSGLALSLLLPHAGK